MGTRALPPQHTRLYAFLRTVIRPLHRAVFGIRGEGLERLPAPPYLMASNHVSMLDWAHLAYFWPGLRFVVDRVMLEQLPIRIGCRIGGAVAVHTDRADLSGLRAAHAVLRHGEPLVIFPEGQISLTGDVQQGYPGVIALAAHTGVPVVPVALRGAFEAFPRWRWLPRFGQVTVVIGKPLPPPSRALNREQQQELADRLMRQIADLLAGREARPAWA